MPTCGATYPWAISGNFVVLSLYVTELNGGLLLLNRVHCNLGSKATCSKLVESLW